MSKDKILLIIVAVVLGFGINVNSHPLDVKNLIEKTPIEKEEDPFIGDNDAPKEDEQPKKEEDSVLIAKTMEEALVMSQKSGKNIIVYFGASWCGPCVKMKTETLVDPEVVQVLNRYVYLNLDHDLVPELGAKYNVRAIPSYFILDKDGEVLKDGGGFKNAKTFLKWIGETHVKKVKKNDR